MKKLLNIGIAVIFVFLFTCLCWKTEKCNFNTPPVYVQDGLHIPGIYLSNYFEKCIKETNNKASLHDQKLKYTSLTFNDTTYYQSLNQYGIHVPAYIRKKLTEGQQ